MGTSHFKSNVIGYDGTEYLATFAAIKTITTISGVTTLNAVTASSNVAKVSGLGDSSYIQLGAEQYLFVGNRSYSASIIAEATALVATPIKGSLYMSRKGNIWCIKTDALASPLGTMD